MFGSSGIFGRVGNRLNVGHKERWLSTVAGIALLATAFLRRRSGWGKAAGLFGGLLMKRGVTGRCELNQALHRNTHLTLCLGESVRGNAVTSVASAPNC